MKASKGLFILFLAVVVTLGLMAAASFGTTAQAEEEVFELTFQSTWPEGDVHQYNFQTWVDKVEKYTAGRVLIETLPAGSVVPAFEVLDAVHDGVLDGGHGWPGYWIGKDRAAVLVGSAPAGPFGMDAWDYIGWIWQGGGHEINNEFFQETLGMDIKWFPVGDSGSQALGWFHEPLESVEDFAGLSYRIPGIPGEMYAGMGVDIVTLPGGEVAAAGERGVIDAAEYVGPYFDYRMGFHEIWDVYMTPAVHEYTTVLEVYFRDDVWEDLPEDIQNIIELVSKEHFQWWDQHQQSERVRHMDMLYHDHDVEFRRTPDDILEASLDAWHDIFRVEYEENPMFRKMADSQREWAGKVTYPKWLIEPAYEPLVEIYWGPGGFMEEEFGIEPPEWLEIFIEE